MAGSPAQGSIGSLLCHPLRFLNTVTAPEVACRSAGVAHRCWGQEGLGRRLSAVHVSLHSCVFSTRQALRGGAPDPSPSLIVAPTSRVGTVISQRWTALPEQGPGRGRLSA